MLAPSSERVPLEAGREQRHGRVAGEKRAVTPAAKVMAASEVGELPALGSRDEHVARVRARRAPAGPARARSDSAPGRARRCLRQARSRRSRARSAARRPPAARPPPPLRGRERRRRLARRRGARRACERPRGIPPGGTAVRRDSTPRRRRRSRAPSGKLSSSRGEPLDRRLAVVRANDHGIAVEKLVEPARSAHQASQRAVRPLERLQAPLGPGQVGGEVVVREVEDEEVEAVPRDEPAPDGGGVLVDRAVEPRADRKRRAGDVGFEEVEEEEPSGSVRRLVPAVPAREPGQADRVARAAAVAREVDRRRLDAGVLERLEHRRRVSREVLVVHGEDRVPDGAPSADRAHGRERGAVLDQPFFTAVVPDEVGDVMDVGIRPGGDRGQADRGQRREDARATPEGALLHEEPERRKAPLLETPLEHRGGEPVDDRENELLAARRGLS